MSTPIPQLPHQSPTPTTTSSVGLGYGIAIAVSILVLISTIMLASYACVRIKSSSTNTRHRSNDNNNEDDYQDEEHELRSITVTGLPGPALVKVGKDMRPKKGVLYPEVVLGESKRLPKPNTGPCSICLCDYKATQTVRCMPDCNHCFHVDCIDQWLKMNPTCPLCRNSPVPSLGPTPTTTPLSEVVPLAFHPR